MAPNAFTACHPHRRSRVSGRPCWWVASNRTSISPSTAGGRTGSPAVGSPNRRATDDRTDAGSRRSPSMALVVRPSSTRMEAMASRVRSASRTRAAPSTLPWLNRALGQRRCKASFVPSKPRPVGLLPDPGGRHLHRYSLQVLMRLWLLIASTARILGSARRGRNDGLRYARPIPRLDRSQGQWRLVQRFMGT